MIARLLSMIKIFARVGTALMLIVLVYSCATVPGLREESSTSVIRVPFVRVLLEDTHDSVTVSGTGQFAIECLQSGRQEVLYASQPVRVINDMGRLHLVGKDERVIKADLDEVNFIPRGSASGCFCVTRGIAVCSRPCRWGRTSR